MNQGELLDEIERRKKRAVDLKIRETLWSLYNRHLGMYQKWLVDDPEMVYRECDHRFIGVLGKNVEFSVGPNKYQLSFRVQNPIEKSDTRTEPETVKDGTLGLKVNGEKIFKFEWRQRTIYAHDGPIFAETLGEITRFIDGLWVLEVTDLLERIVATKSESAKKETLVASMLCGNDSVSEADRS